MLVLFLVVLTAVASVLVQAAQEFYAIHIARRLNRSIDLRKKYGSLAVVTGATDGIGKGYCFALAAKQVNLILVGRNETKLQTTISEIQSKHPTITATYILHDFSRPSPNDATKFHDALRPHAHDVGILINNVGIVSESPNEKFLQSMQGASRDMVHVNIESQLLMTQVILPFMLQRSAGIIVTISSLASLHPGFGTIVYAATKVFNDYLSRGLRQELSGTGIEVQTVYPGRIATRTTPAHLRGMPDWIVPNAMDYAAGCVETMGRLTETYGSLNHRLQAMMAYGVKLTPTAFVDRLVIWIRAGRGGRWKRFDKQT